MKIGERAETRRTYGQGDRDGFARLTGVTPATVPEPLIAGLFSYLLGVELPGAGTNYLKQDLKFSGAAPFGEELNASVEVTRLRPDKHLVDLETLCRRADGTIICRGRALVLAKDVAQ